MGLLNLAVGGGGIALAAMKLKDRRVLDGSLRELEASRTAIVSAVNTKAKGAA